MVILFVLSYFVSAQISFLEFKQIEPMLNPNTPIFKITGNDSLDKANYAFQMRAYCKENPPFPKLRNQGQSQEDIDRYNNEVTIWQKKYGDYFPIFVEYSNFSDKGRTAEDDQKAYQEAKKLWIRNNTEKYIEIEPLIQNLEQQPCET